MTDRDSTSRARNSGKPLRFSDEPEYALIVFHEDGIKRVVPEHQIKETAEDGTSAYDSLNKRYYPCSVLLRSENKEFLLREQSRLEGKPPKRKAPAPKKDQIVPKKKVQEKEKEKNETVPKKKVQEKEKEKNETVPKKKVQEKEKEKNETVPKKKVQEKEKEKNKTGSAFALQCLAKEQALLQELSKDSTSGEAEQPSRPTVGGKCPRKTWTTCSSDEEEIDSQEMDQLKEENISLHSKVIYLEEKVQTLQETCTKLGDELAHYKSLHSDENGNSAPRPGKVNSQIAAMHQMAELSPGTGIFVYPLNIKSALRRSSSGTKMACSLLNSFYTNEELSRMGTMKDVPKTYLNAIIDFVLKNTSDRVATEVSLKQALRTKVSGLKFRAAKKPVPLQQLPAVANIASASETDESEV